MPRLPSIPDHDGRPHPGLPAALVRIDRALGAHSCRRFVRAVAAFNHGDPLLWHREMQVGLDEVAFLGGLSGRALRELVGAKPRRSLDSVLGEIDRRFGLRAHRRFLRAAACYDHLSEEGWWAEMGEGLAEAGDETGLTRRDLLSLVLPADEWLRRQPVRTS